MGILPSRSDFATKDPHPSFIALGTAPDGAQFIVLLLRLFNTEKTIEVGVFTGYSLLLTALTTPQYGKIIVIDAD